MSPTPAYVGQSIKRSEDVRLLTGRAAFVADLHFEGAAAAAVLRSPHGHARIRTLDVAGARAMPGVLDVLAFDDFADRARTIPLRLAPLPGVERYQQYPLARDRVRFAGEPVALVVAEDRYLAEDALAAIAVEYEPLPAVTSIEQAVRDETLLHEEAGSNVAAAYDVAKGDPDGAFARAAHTRREVFSCHRHGAVPLETRGLVAAVEPGSGRLEVWGATKVNHYNRRLLAGLLGMAEERIELIETDVGGGFGARGEFYPEDFLVPLAALRLGRPVKWIEDRREHLLSANHSREMECALEIAVDEDGRILALRGRLRGDMGAYTRTNGGIVPSKAVQFIPGPYRIENFGCSIAFVMTNKTPVGTYRGPGRFEANFFRERLFDMVAADLGLDAAAFRMKNLLTEADMPYPLGDLVPYEPGEAFDIGDARAPLARALEEIGHAAGRTHGRRADGRLHGIGMSCFAESTSAGPAESARIVIHDEAEVELYVGSASMGQGHKTVFAQICADELGLPFERITVRHGSTSHVEDGHGTFASRATVMGGSAVQKIAREVRGRLLRAASLRLNLAEDELEYRDGSVLRAGEDGAAPLLDFGGLLTAVRTLGGGDAGEAALDVTASYEQTRKTFTYGAQAVEASVDPELGRVEIDRYVAVEDIGRAVNPMLVHGQAIGGAAQGLGGALLDEFVYDGDGQLLTVTLADYLLPASTDVPRIDSITLEETPSERNPLGVKGAGEGGIVAAGAAIANAVAAALAPLGVDVTDLPLRPDRIRRLIDEAAARSRDGPNRPAEGGA